MKFLIYIVISFFLIINLSNVSALGTGTTNSGVIDQTQINAFKLDGVKVIYNNELILNFNHELLNTDGIPVDLKIVDKSNNFNTFDINTTTISGSTLNVKLTTQLKTNTEYEMIVISIYDNNYDIIGKGINASKLFKTPIIFDIAPIINNISVTDSGVNLNSINGNISVTDSGVELNSASDVNLNSIFKDVIPKEKVIVTPNATDNTANTFDTANNVKRLPTTGPTEWLLLAISLFFGLIYFTFKTKYRN